MKARLTLLAALIALGSAEVLAQPPHTENNPPEIPKSQSTPLALQTFFQTAVSSEQLEIQSSQLASRGSSSGDVNAFATRILEDHTQSAKELRELAKRKNVTVRDELLPNHQHMLQDLRKADPGEEFNREFRRLQIASHQNSVELFEGMMKTVKDKQIRAFIDRRLPILREHLEMAQKLPDTSSPGAN